MNEPNLNARVMLAGNVVSATQMELAAAVDTFKAACLRNDGPRITITGEAAHAALQAHLDAHNSLYAVIRDSMPSPK